MSAYTYFLIHRPGYPWHNIVPIAPRNTSPSPISLFPSDGLTTRLMRQTTTTFFDHFQLGLVDALVKRLYSLHVLSFHTITDLISSFAYANMRMALALLLRNFDLTAQPGNIDPDSLNEYGLWEHHPVYVQVKERV